MVKNWRKGVGMNAVIEARAAKRYHFFGALAKATFVPCA
jgi:hypothetical protein